MRGDGRRCQSRRAVFHVAVTKSTVTHLTALHTAVFSTHPTAVPRRRDIPRRSLTALSLRTRPGTDGTRRTSRTLLLPTRILTAQMLRPLRHAFLPAHLSLPLLPPQLRSRPAPRRRWLLSHLRLAPELMLCLHLTLQVHPECLLCWNATLQQLRIECVLYRRGVPRYFTIYCAHRAHHCALRARTTTRGLVGLAAAAEVGQAALGHVSHN